MKGISILWFFISPSLTWYVILLEKPVLSPKINSIKVYENPVKNSKEIFKINLNENVVYLGEKQNRYILVEGSKGAGWVREILLKIKK